MKTAISQTAESIKSEASREYATFQYVDNTAGNLASEAETNAKGYADKVGTGANSYADTVGTNAKNYADTKANKALTDAKPPGTSCMSSVTRTTELTRACLT